MKKRIFILLLTFFLFVGCTTEDDHRADVIEAGEIKMYESTHLLETVKDDLTGDGVEEEIMMYITPSPIDEETGEATAWEHLMHWQIFVKDGEKTYPLYEQSARGLMKFWISNQPEKRLIVANESPVQLIVYEYTYKEGVFEKKILVDTGLTDKQSMFGY